MPLKLLNQGFARAAAWMIRAGRTPTERGLAVELSLWIVTAKPEGFRFYLYSVLLHVRKLLILQAKGIRNPTIMLWNSPNKGFFGATV